MRSNTDEGGHITLRLETLPDDRYRFTCTDDGIGMTDEFIKHIFEDYSRAEDSRISNIQGTGLGMSVVKGFMDLMNGHLDIQSELGKGSTFTVEVAFPEASEPGEYFAIFMDMQMPVMGGVEATKAIRSSGHGDRDIPIFAMTANTFISDRNSCREAGMNGYICKPINLSEIVATLQECVPG